MARTLGKNEFEFFSKKMNLLLLGEGVTIDRNRVRDICWKVFQEGIDYGRSLT